MRLSPTVWIAAILARARSQPAVTAAALATGAAGARGVTANIAASGGIITPPSGPLSAGALSVKAVGKLSTTTKMLGQLGAANDFVDVPYAVLSLEGKIATSAVTLFQAPNSRMVTRIGDQWIPRGNAGLLQGFGDTWSTPREVLGSGDG